MNTLSRKVATIAGFPIHVDLTFLLLGALFVFPDFGNTFTEHFVALMRFPILVGSILLHELGHAWAIQRYGHGRSKILLWGMGGLCINRSRYGNKEGLRIALAGPGAGLLLGLPSLAAWLIANSAGLQGELATAILGVLSFLVFVNVGWSLMNLLPIFPLDGGRVLMYALRIYGHKSADRSVKIAGLVGLILLLPLGLLCLASGQIFMIFIIFFIGHTSWQAYKGGTAAVAG